MLMTSTVDPPSPPKRTGSWDTVTTYSSLYEDDHNVKKTFINPNSVDDLGRKQEQPKIALTKRFSWLHPLVHLLPIGVTLGIVQLSFREVYWDDDTRYDTRWQAFLQFPAKVHEILIVGSLSAMVLHIFRRMLVGPHGIPLGLMVGAFQIGSAEYLISKSYIKPLRHSLQTRHLKTFLTALALGLAILYSFLVGPASAGALLPVLTWWDLRTPFNDSLPLTSYISRTTSDLYPMALQRSSIDANCLVNAWNLSTCPAQGFSVLNLWASTRAQETYWYNVTEGKRHNPVMPSVFSGQVQREIVTKLVTARDSSTAAALTATLHSSVLALADSFWHYISSNTVGKANWAKRLKLMVSPDTPISIPFVQVQCSSYGYNAARYNLMKTKSDMVFETGAMISDFSTGTPNDYISKEWIVPGWSWNFNRSQNITDVTWVDSSKIKGTLNESLHASLAAVVTLPFLYPVAPEEQSSLIIPCIIDARWATTDTSFDTADDFLKTSLTDWLDSTDLLTGNVDVKAALAKWNISDPISLSSDWATTLSPVVWLDDPNDIFYNLTFGEVLLQWFMYQDKGIDGEALLSFWAPQDAANEVAIILSTMVADWLSRSTLSGTNYTTVLSAVESKGKPVENVSTLDLLGQWDPGAFSTAPLASLVDQTAVVFKVQRYGWGYGLNNDTIWFSIIILLLHAFLVLLYFVYSFVFWWRAKGWVSGSWGSIGELMALAIQSPSADELRNTGAGVRLSKTWMTKLRLRELGSDPGQLELVVGTRAGTVIPTEHRLQPDKEYS